MAQVLSLTWPNVTSRIEIACQDHLPCKLQVLLQVSHHCLHWWELLDISLPWDLKIAASTTQDWQARSWSVPTCRGRSNSQGGLQSCISSLPLAPAAVNASNGFWQVSIKLGLRVYEYNSYSLDQSCQPYPFLSLLILLSSSWLAYFGWFNSKGFASDRWSTPSSEWVIYTQRSEHRLFQVSDGWWMKRSITLNRKHNTGRHQCRVDRRIKRAIALTWDCHFTHVLRCMVEDVWDVRWISNMLAKML